MQEDIFNSSQSNGLQWAENMSKILLSLSLCLAMFVCTACNQNDQNQFRPVTELPSDNPSSDSPSVSDSVTSIITKTEKEKTEWDIPQPETNAKPTTPAIVSTSPTPTSPTGDATPQTVTKTATKTVADKTANPFLKLPSLVKARKIKLLIKEKTFKVEGPEEAIRVSFDDIDLLKVLNMEPVESGAEEHFPQWLKNLDGRRIRIRGFMYPPRKQTNIRNFFVARDNQICCFGKSPKLYDKFRVELRKGVTTPYILNQSFDIVGVFRIDPFVDFKSLLEIYRIEDAVIIK